MLVSPVSGINEGVINRVIFDAWPKSAFHTITGPKAVQEFYNNCYSEFQSALHTKLKLYHPAAWLLTAYSQLELWTAVYHNKIEGRRDLAPAARSGWRFIIENSLERNKENRIRSEEHTDRPTLKDIETVFTILINMQQVAELSNYLHNLASNFTSASIKFSPSALNGLPLLNDQETEYLTSIRSYITKTSNKSNFSDFSPSTNKLFQDRVDTFLRKHWEIEKKLILKFIEAVMSLSISVRASILVQPFDDFVSLISETAKIETQLVERIITFTFLRVDHAQYENRDILRKNQSVRLLNFAGVILELKNNFKAIYDHNSALRKEVVCAKTHVIVSAGLLAEWLDVFYYKVAFAQREDLKRGDEKVKRDLSDLEKYFKVDVFEGEVKNFFSQHDFITISLKKSNRKELECGQIDILAYNPKNRTLVVGECKAHAPIIDARYIGQVLQDHFHQKKYHQKFLKKIDWVKANGEAVVDAFHLEGHKSVQPDFFIKSVFITWSGSVVKFMVTEYQVMTFEELKTKLQTNDI